MGNRQTADRDRQNTGGELSRRSFLTATAASTLATAGSQTASAQAETYRFGGEVEAWHGRAPESISGQTNPTIHLTAGQEYRVVWENLDGQPHNFVVQNAEGTAIVSSPIMSEEGATQTVTFTATQEMVQYICQVHPTTMVGDVEITGGGGGQPQGLQIPTGAYAVGAAFLLAFLSPLLFALFLFSRRRGDDETEGMA